MGKKISKIKKSNKDKSFKKEQKTSKKNKISKNGSLISQIKNKNLIKIATPIIFILFIMWFAFYVRSGPIELNGLDNRIESNTYAQIKSMISSNLELSYSNLKKNSPNDFQALVDKEYLKVINSGVYEYQGQKLIISDLVKQNQKQVKEAFKDENGQTYLNAIDPYHFLHLSRNYYKNGYTGDKLINKIPWLTTKLSPIGYKGSYTPQFHIWLESKLFALNNINKENSSNSEKTSAIYLIPVFLVIFSVIPIFLILRKFSSDLFALFGSIFLVSIGTFVSRTIAGFVDTDGYVILFPLLITMFLIYSFIYRNKYLTLILGILAGLFQGLFLWAWSPGWFIFIFSILTLISYIIYLLILKYLIRVELEDFNQKVINSLITLTSFGLSSLIFTYSFINKNIFNLSIKGILGSQSSIASISQSNIWPNVFSSVAELNPASFGQIISSVGGAIIFTLALIGIVFLTLDFKSKNKKQNILKRIIMIFSLIWFMLIIFGNNFVFLTANHPLVFLILLFLPIGISLIVSLINNNTSNKLFLAILLSIWIAGTIYMSLNGVRFILLLAPAFAISFGLGLFYLSEILNYFFIKEFKITNKLKQSIGGIVITTILFLVLFIPMATQAIAISNGTTPNFDDAWYNTMYKIKDNSNEDAIITSWWDFGHFFAAISERGVTFDGSSQTTPRAHWVGKLLLESNEEKSLDILRMLVCGGNEAFNNFYEFVGKDTSDAVKINKILYQTFGENRTKTREVIETNKYYSLSKEEVDTIMENLACKNPREDFLITSADMVGKAGVWAHWGSWDFTKKYVYDNYNKLDSTTIAGNIDENITLIKTYIEELKAIDLRASLENINRDSLINQWFAIYPGFLGNGNCIPKNNTLLCGMNFRVTASGNINSLSATNYPGFEGCSQTSSGVICGYRIDLRTGKIVTNKFPLGETPFNRIIGLKTQDELGVYNVNKGSGFDLLLIPNSKDNVVAYLTNSPLGDSLFMKLFYLNGFTTKHFEKFDEQNSMTGVNIKVWKVKWEIEDKEAISNLFEENKNTTTLKVGEVKINNSNSSN